MEYLRALQEETFRPFQNHIASYNHIRNTSPVDRLESMLRKISRHIVKLTNHHLETGRSLDSLPGLSILMSVLPMVSETECPVCYEEANDKFLEALDQSDDVFSRLYHRQSRLEAHFRADRHSVIGRMEAETQLYSELSTLIMRRLRNHFKDLGLGGTIRLFHPPIVGHALFTTMLELPDCLGRTTLHQFLDITDLDHSALDLAWCFSWINRQDVLGRSPLHIVCQKGWEVRANPLIFFNADPNLATIYGSLPLHYAAASGHLINCKSLIGKMEHRYVIRKDCEGKTPLDYARANGHMEVFRFLSQFLTVDPW